MRQEWQSLCFGTCIETNYVYTQFNTKVLPILQKWDVGGQENTF